MVKDSISLAVFGVMAMFTMNVSMIPATLAGLPGCFMTSLPADCQAGFLFLMGLLVAALILDAKAVLHMFFDLGPDPESKIPQWSLPAKLNLSAEVHGKFCKVLVAVNWAAVSGLICSSLKLSVVNPLQSEYIVGDMSLRVAHDLVSGDLQLNPLVRGGQRWESAYGLICAFYLVLHFGFSVMRHSNFDFARFLFGKGTFMILGHIETMAFGGLFGRGLWPFACLFGTAHLMLLWLASRFVVHREVAKGRSPQAAEKLLCVLRAAAFLFVISLFLAVYIFLMCTLGRNSIWSTLIIYGPVNIFTLILIRDAMARGISSRGCSAGSEGVAERIPGAIGKQKSQALTGLLLCVHSHQLNAIDLLRLAEVCGGLMNEVGSSQIWRELLAQQLQPMIDAFFDGKLPAPSKGKTWKQHYFEFRWSWKELARQQTGRMLVQICKQQLSGRGLFHVGPFCSLWPGWHAARPKTYGVYDVTDFSQQPCTDLRLAADLVDATDLFEMYAHSGAAVRMLETMAVPGLENLQYDQEIEELHGDKLCRWDARSTACVKLLLGLFQTGYFMLLLGALLETAFRTGYFPGGLAPP